MKSLPWSLIQYDWCPYEKGKFGHRDRSAQREETEMQGENHLKMKAEIRAVHLQAKDCQLTTRS